MISHRTLAAVLFVSATLLAPSSAPAAQERVERRDITIESDREFDAAHGVRSGRGTRRDPYVISGWNVHHLSISDTAKAVRIVNNTIGTLTLNWIGPYVDVRTNDVGDLRVNENVERTGAPTSGSITNNWFGVVGQIRHFDGRFAFNRVGVDEADGAWNALGLELFRGPAVNFDGFNGARFERNTVYGPVDVRLHGHHHSSGFGRQSHMHAGRPAEHAGHAGHGVDHTKRFHEVVVANNTITSRGSYALAYLDTNHSGNDRTATSETDPALEMPHVHHTRAAFRGNKLVGAGILVDVFNATDELHQKPPSGSLELSGNSISMNPREALFFGPTAGIDVRRARYLSLRIARNTVTGPPASQTEAAVPGWFSSGQGLLLEDLDHAHVMIEALAVSAMTYGVRASQMSDSVHWTIKGLRTTDVEQPLSYDSSVENAPERR